MLGEWSFRHFDVVVDRRVLIPRPETELVVEIAIAEATRFGLRRGRQVRVASSLQHPVPLIPVVDLGTGSGVIAIALEAEFAHIEVWACDLSADALDVARINAIGNAARRIRTVQGDWFDALPSSLVGEIALVVANPPYISAEEFEDLDPQVRDHEPFAALVGGITGSEAVFRILDDAPGWLAPGAPMVIELASDRAEISCAYANGIGAYSRAEICDDLTGRPRALVVNRHA